MDAPTQLAQAQDVATKVSLLFQKRIKIAQEHYTKRVEAAHKQHAAAVTAKAPQPLDLLTSWYRYSVDIAQRSVLFWDTLRQRGNNFIDHTKEGLPPVLTFEYDMIADGRTFEQPVSTLR